MAHFITAIVLITCSVEVLGNNQDTEVPMNVQGVHIRTLDVIVMCWQYVQNATYYEVLTIFPDLTTQYFNVSEPRFVLQNIDGDSLGRYTFRVRQWNGTNYSGFSQEAFVNVDTEELNKTIIGNGTKSDKEMRFYVKANKTTTFTWVNAPEELTSKDASSLHISCLTFTMETCLRVSQYREWTTPQSIVMDVRILNHLNKETNKTETIYLKQQTINYDQVHREFLGYRDVSCQSVRSTQMKFDIYGLLKGSNYTYWVKVHLGGRLLGTFDEGVFTVTGYVPPVIVFLEEITPIGVYFVTCGFLIFILLTGFVVSLVCRWERVVNDLAVKKDKVRKKKESEMYEQIKGKLLTESFINNKTR